MKGLFCTTDFYGQEMMSFRRPRRSSFRTISRLHLRRDEDMAVVGDVTIDMLKALAAK